MAIRSNRAFIADLSAATFVAHVRALGCEAACPSGLKTSAEIDAAMVLVNGLSDFALWETQANRAEELADEGGQTAMLLAADQGRGELAVVFSGLRGVRDCALWHLVNRPAEFALAEAIYYSEGRREKSTFWQGFAAGPAKGLAAASIDKEALEAKLREAFQFGEGEGPRLEFEIIDRPENPTRASADRLIQVSVWREGAPRIMEHFGDHGRRRDTFRFSIGAALLYNAETGALDVVTDQGGAGLRKRLAQAFCNATLDREAPIPLGSRPVTLASLRSRRAFPCEASDGITAVVVAGVTAERGMGEGLLHLDAPADGDIWDAAASWGVHLESAEITRAVIAVRFAATAIHPVERTKKVKLALPSGCTLSHWSDRERAIGERLLAVWGLRADR